MEQLRLGRSVGRLPQVVLSLLGCPFFEEGDAVLGWFTSGVGNSQTAPMPAAGRETERVASSEILGQAQWLYEQHERRVQNSQSMAVAVLTIVGTILALVTPSALSGDRAPWRYALVGLVFVAVLATMLECMRVLAPRVRTHGLPSVAALREFAHRSESVTADRMPVPVTQFAHDLLNPLRLTDPSPLCQSAADAARRTEALSRAYRWLAATFLLVTVMSTLFAVVP